MLVSNSNPKKAALTRFVDEHVPVKKVKNSPAWETKPRNKEQQYALNLLMDPDVPVVSLIGKAGSGKTLLALAAGLEQTLGRSTYKKMVVTKNAKGIATNYKLQWERILVFSLAL